MKIRFQKYSNCLLILVALLTFSLSAQENCGNAVPVPELDGSPCATASPAAINDLGAGSCGQSGTIDTWFSFTAQGGTATINVSSNQAGWRPEF